MHGNGIKEIAICKASYADRSNIIGQVNIGKACIIKRPVTDCGKTLAPINLSKIFVVIKTLGGKFGNIFTERLK